MNKVTRWLFTGALLVGLGGCGAQAAQAAVHTGGASGSTVTVAGDAAHGAKTEVRIGSNGINVNSGSSHIRIGGAGVDISNGAKSVVVTGVNSPCPNERQVVEIGQEAKLPAGESACQVVAIFGNSVVDGDVSNAAVAIMGNLHVNGSVGNNAVSIFGNSDINGPIAGNAVAIFGDLKLGPKANIGGQAVNLFGSMQRNPAAVIQGGTVNLMPGIFHGVHDFAAWGSHCLILGRLLAPRADIGWAWGVAVAILLFYVLLAALFREGVQRCIQTLDDHPGASILAAIAVALLTPILMVALVLTVVGIFAIPLFWLALLCAGLFGRVVALGWLGGRIVRGVHGGMTQPALYVLVGGVLALALYMVPILGFLVYALIGLLGFGAVMYTLVLAMRAARGASAPAAQTGGARFAAGAGAPAGEAGTTAEAAAGAATGEETGAAAPPGAATMAPTLELATLPRAGFWLRMLALLIDVVLVGFVLSMIGHHGTDGMLLVLAGYGAIMWKLKGTTVGGIICHLQVVRIDGQPVTWETAILRALGCFLSLVAAGFGFFWIAFDRERQGWHDKIAGTVVVLVPKAGGLV